MDDSKIVFFFFPFLALKAVIFSLFVFTESMNQIELSCYWITIKLLQLKVVELQISGRCAHLLKPKNCRFHRFFISRFFCGWLLN